MMKRLISRLDIKNGRVIKGISFEGLRVVGEPKELALKYYREGVNELLYIDTVASLYGRSSLAPFLSECSKNIFVPITAGGGVRSTDDAQKLLSAGADKIAVNSEAVRNPKLLSELVARFGSQCVVSSIQVRYSEAKDDWYCLIDQGRELTSIDLSSWLRTVQDFNVGEIIVSSVDMDGRMSGPDKNLIEFCSKYINIPWIYSGGITTVDFSNYDQLSNPPSMAVGAAMHYNKFNFKLALESQSFSKSSNSQSISCHTVNESNLTDTTDIHVLDIGLGNIQSLCNALEYLGYNPVLTSDHHSVTNASLLFMPGVGAFPEAMDRLHKSNLVEPLQSRHKSKKPIIGICLGMQLLFSSSDELHETQGLSLINGSVSVLDPTKSSSPFLVPHIGWSIASSSHFETNPFYFVHSYAVHNLPSEHVLFDTQLSADYSFVSGVKVDNTVGLQFHPERSGPQGLLLLQSLIELFL